MCKQSTPRYSDNIDYLISSILYLSTHKYYWARTPEGMSSELSLDEAQLSRVFNAFPGIFRKSRKSSPNGQPYYSLQARYALRDGGDTQEPNKISYIEPMTTDRIELLINFVLNMAEHEKSDIRNKSSNMIAVIASVLSACAILVAAYIALGVKL